MLGDDEDEVPTDGYSLLIGGMAAVIIFAIVAFGFWATGISLPVILP